MRRIVLLAVVLALGPVACSDDSSAFTEENLARELVDGDLLEEEVADCVAEDVFDTLDQDMIDELQDADLDRGGLPRELQDALTDAIITCTS